MRVDRRAVVLSAGALAACGPPTASSAPASSVHAASGPVSQLESFIGPLPGWKNAKTDFGAVGDGRADDTQALQKALESLTVSGSTALYLPAGRYRITATLVLPRKGPRGAMGLNVQGEDPARTTLVWDGPRDGRMLEFGGWYSKLGRLTFDGAGRAATAMAHGEDFVTANEIADCVFTDVGVGIEAGSMAHSGIAETSVNRCRFLRCSVAGAALRNFNSLDWWFWRCRFEDCRIGLTNLNGAGNFHAYDSVFLRSTEADIAIRNTGFLSFRDNLSIGSKTFFVARAVEAGAQLTFQRNRVIDTTDAAAIHIADLGPVTLLDNTFISRPGQMGSVVEARSALGVAIGNQVTTTGQAIALRDGATVLDTVRIARSARIEPAPAPVAPLAHYAGPVEVIALGTPASAIQASIDALAKRGGGALYFAPGGHAIDRTLTLPAAVDIRLVGDGIPSVTRLNWSGVGTGPLLRLRTPSRVQVQDLTVAGDNRADGMELAGVDAGQGQVLFLGTKAGNCKDAGYQFERLARTQVVLRNIDHLGNQLGMRITGAGAGKPNAPVVIASGSSSDNELSYELTAGARLLARDIWYESSKKPVFLRLTGEVQFTLNGSNVANPRLADQPPVVIEGLKGQALFLGVLFSGYPVELPAVIVAGSEPRSKVLFLGCQGNGEFYADRSSGGHAVRLHGLTYTQGGLAKTVPDRGQVDDAFIRQMLEPARAPTPVDTAQVRFNRVAFDQCRVGARVTA